MRLLAQLDGNGRKKEAAAQLLERLEKEGLQLLVFSASGLISKIFTHDRFSIVPSGKVVLVNAKSDFESVLSFM